MVALIFLPNIGLWSLYKDKHLVKSTEPGEQQVSATQRKITGKLVRLVATLGWGWGWGVRQEAGGFFSQVFTELT